MPEVSWLLFILASLVLIITPGQDMILVMSRSIAQGALAGVVTAAGVSPTRYSWFLISLTDLKPDFTDWAEPCQIRLGCLRFPVQSVSW